MKKIKFILLTFMLMFLVPSIAYADAVTVKFKTNPTGPDLTEIAAEKNVTTIGELRVQLASLVDMEKYVLLNTRYEVPNDNDVVCDTNASLYCSQSGPSTYNLTMYLIEEDKTVKSYTLKSIPPKDEEMARNVFETNYDLFGSLAFRSCDSTFTTCTFIDSQASKLYTNVKITYDYDTEIAKIAQKAVDEGLINNNEFEATDVELLNYLLYGGSLANYTSAFKNQLSNYNFASEIDQRGGAFEPFNTAAIGFYRATYNGTIYAIKDFIEINGPHIIYIPDDATDKVEAVKTRIKDIFGNDASKLKVEESNDTINELLTSYHLSTVGAQGDETYLIIENNNPDVPYYGMQMFFAVVKDSSKVNNTKSFKSSDLLTNVSVESDGDVPLDTIVGVNHITSGDEYDKLIKVLSIEEGEVFDISLNSIAQKKNITSLASGKFLVKIPIPSKYEGKNLIVYYVDSSNKVTPYEVTIKDGYATFETDHFSTYTLAINNTTEPETNTSTDSTSTSTTAATTTNTTSNPATGDKIMQYIILLAISTVGLIGLPIYVKNRK